MENLNSVNWKEREEELLNAFSGRFRRVWIQYTRLGSLCITAFPIAPHEKYQIFCAWKVQDWSVENLKNIVLSQIENKADLSA